MSSGETTVENPMLINESARVGTLTRERVERELRLSNWVVCHVRSALPRLQLQEKSNVIFSRAQNNVLVNPDVILASNRLVA
jgi:hypothetical protein